MKELKTFQNEKKRVGNWKWKKMMNSPVQNEKKKEKKNFQSLESSPQNYISVRMIENSWKIWSWREW